DQSRRAVRVEAAAATASRVAEVGGGGFLEWWCGSMLDVEYFQGRRYRKIGGGGAVDSGGDLK
ncbi:hypothetical protein U1Q18_029425, partial [Sarracenia purpurea var. burkii]